jgi:lipopolysaccharide/colanic/teichoic acid biosynthesis glycosyltransferase
MAFGSLVESQKIIYFLGASLIQSIGKMTSSNFEPARTTFGEFASMSALTSSPTLNSTTFDSTSVAQDEAQLQSPIPLETDWVTLDSSMLLVKRIIDVFGAIVGLLLFTPVMLFIALLIRWDSPGPVLFRQWRRGYRGRTFQVLKFRTMTIDAEQKLRDLENSNESAGGVLFKLRNDPRVTRLGSFLRRHSFDELPQFINVLRGEMSLVGPRPLQLRDSDLLLASNPLAYHRRLQVIPGLTGPWQVSGRSNLSSEQMVELDLGYIEKLSLGRDFWIICKTFFVVVLRKGAY